MFSDEIMKNVNGIQWWLAQKDEPEIETQVWILKSFLCAVASSASVERVFSTFSFVHSDIRNKLDLEKSGKLEFLYKYCNYNEENMIWNIKRYSYSFPLFNNCMVRIGQFYVRLFLQ